MADEQHTVTYGEHPLGLVSKQEAKALGLKRYFTGKPCKRGHVCERQASKVHPVPPCT